MSICAVKMSYRHTCTTSTAAKATNNSPKNNSLISSPQIKGSEPRPRGATLPLPPSWLCGIVHFIVWGRTERTPFVGHGWIMFTSSVKLPNFDIVKVQRSLIYAVLFCQARDKICSELIDLSVGREGGGDYFIFHCPTSVWYQLFRLLLEANPEFQNTGSSKLVIFASQDCRNNQ